MKKKDGISRVMESDGKLAFFVSNRYMIFSEDWVDTCNLEMMFDVERNTATFAMPQDSEYLPLFKAFIQELLEKGIVNELIQKYPLTYKVGCPPDEQAFGLGFEKLALLFVMVLGGYLGYQIMLKATKEFLY